MDSGAIGWHPLVKSWVARLAQKTAPMAALLERILFDFLQDALPVVRSCNQPLYVSDAGLVTSLLNILDCFLIHINSPRAALVRNASSRGI